MPDRSIDSLAGRLSDFHRQVLPAVDQEVVARLATDGLEHSVEISPVLSGAYQASHRVGSGRARSANLSRRTQHGKPGQIEAKAGLRGRRPFQDVSLSNDAAHATAVEVRGWSKTPPYRVYQRTLDQQIAKWPDLAEEAWDSVIRGRDL